MTAIEAPACTKCDDSGWVTVVVKDWTYVGDYQQYGFDSSYEDEIPCGCKVVEVETYAD